MRSPGALDQKTIGVDDCHLVLHLIGHEAYRIQGEDLESLFSANKGRMCLGGFLHGVEAEVAATGDQKTLWRLCGAMRARNLNNGPCYHGAGHTAFESTGNVHDSLAFCDSLKGGPESDLSNCYRGVFSEVGNAMGGGDTNTGLPKQALVDPEQNIFPGRPFELCRALPEQYAASCYSQLAKRYHSDTAPLFGVYACDRASSETLARDLCVSTVFGIAMRKMLDTGTMGDAARYMNEMPVRFQKAALAGLRDAYNSHFDGSQEHVWKTFCRGLDDPTLREMCPMVQS